MSVLVFAGAGLIGGAGAVGRVIVERVVTEQAASPFPYGTLLVNLSGAFLIGLLVGAGAHGDTSRLLGTGVLGGYTTFSTWMVQSRLLDGEGERRLAVLNIVLSLVLGVLAVWLGRKIGASL